MHLLTRICLQNWYLIDALDIDINGASALIGPTGAGKSSIQDAIQTVIAGNNANRLHLNASASGRSQRSVRDYCLGYMSDPSEGGKPLRERCESVIALVFRDEEDGTPITVGLALEARASEPKEEVLSRFIAPGYAYSVETFKRSDPEGEYMAPWDEISQSIQESCPGFEEYRTSAERFTADMLAAMSGPGTPPNARHFLRAFANALAFKPIFDPTVFVRDYILEPDPLDVERVRQSIATWQGFVATIEELEARLRRLQHTEKRFRGWGRAYVRAANARWTMAAAEARRAAFDYVALAATLKEYRSNLDRERGIMLERRSWVKELEHNIGVKRVLAHESGSSARIRHIEVEISLAERERKDILARWADLASAFSSAGRLSALAGLAPASFSKALMGASLSGVVVDPSRSAEDTLRGRAMDLDSMVHAMRGLEGLEKALEDKADQISQQIREMQSEIEQMEIGLSRVGQGSAPLSPETVRLLRHLESRGIEAVPLCDVVEVVDEDWQYAVEALLGRGREALIVQPDRLREAFDVMYAHRNECFGCTLIKTTKTESLSPRVPADSIMSAVRTEDPHAYAFLVTRLGSCRMAETESDLERMDRAIMRNGKSTSGMTLGVNRDLRQLILGRNARGHLASQMRSAVREKQDAVSVLKADLSLLREGARSIPGIRQAIERAGMMPSEIERALNDLNARIQSLQVDMKAMGSSEAGSLFDEIKELENERDGYIQELTDEIEPRVETLQRQVVEVEARLEIQRKSLRDAVRAKLAAIHKLRDQDVVRTLEIDQESGLDSVSSLSANFRRSLSERSGKELRGWLASTRNDAKAIADAADSEAKREGAGAIRELSEYVANWRIDFPISDGDPISWGYAWVVAERQKLERNELRAYRDQCMRAEAEMRHMLKEDLLTKLAEKFEKVRIRLDVLNRRLERHRFTGQKYGFESSINQRYAKVHLLATRVAGSPEHAQAILSGRAGEETELLEEALAEVQSLIDGSDETKSLADYRNYFTFELFMTDAEGRKTSMSSRAVRGSGGEAQAPFYVAIAASLASAYYPAGVDSKHKGMGLVLFDEAFNKLDIRNTQALLNFFRDVGLQLMIAAPEDKRTTFTEVLDTIVTVNKSIDGRSVYIDSEFPGELARKALGAINPDRIGIEGFRGAEAAE